MSTRHPVLVQSNAFLFCRWSITVILWYSFLFHAAWALWLVFVVLGLSALLGIGYAPMIVLYTYTLGIFLPSKNETLDRSAMRFAHTLGTAFSALCLLLLSTAPRFAWGAVLLLAILKTISAFGYCPASKLYVCATGGCCPLSRRLFGEKQHGG